MRLPLRGVAAGTVHPVAGEAVVADGRVAGRHGSCERARLHCRQPVLLGDE